MDKIKQKSPKHEAETCWNDSNKATLFYSYYTVLNFAILIFACPIFRELRNVVLAKLSENKVIEKRVTTFLLKWLCG